MKCFGNVITLIKNYIKIFIKLDLIIGKETLFAEGMQLSYIFDKLIYKDNKPEK